MFNKNIKLFLAAATLAYAVYQILETYVGNGIMPVSYTHLTLPTTPYV